MPHCYHRFRQWLRGIIPYPLRRFVVRTLRRLHLYPPDPSTTSWQFFARFDPSPTTCYDVVCFSVIDWEFRYQRPQQLMSQFAAHGHRVFYVNTQFHAEVSEVGTRQIGKNILEIQLPGTPDRFIYSDTLTEDDLENARRALEAFAHRVGITEAIVVVQLPFWAPLARQMKDRLGWRIIYDCMDDHSGFAANSEAMLEHERDLIALSDLLVITSHVLEDKFHSSGHALARISNGVDFDHFSKAVTRLSGADELENVKSPVIGYYGAIAEWFDFDLLRDAIRDHPKWMFVLIGSTTGADQHDDLLHAPTVMFLGEKPYAELPAYLSRFDVCCIPFKRTPLTEATNPIKFFEYLSAGKPVVSTPLPELEPFADLFYAAHTPQEFSVQIAQALKEDKPEMAMARIEYARLNTWSRRFESLQQAIQVHLPKVGIVIVNYKNLPYLKLCLESIWSRTHYPNFEVVVVDNGSGRDVADYLQRIAKSESRLKVILNGANLGFARANNLGAQALTSCHYLVLLNNDTVVTHGWLPGLIHYLDRPDVGLVGPVTNWAGNEARIDVTYRNTAGLDQFADEYVHQHRAECFEIPMLAMYCVAMRREVYDEVGPLDEQFGIGLFEDDDYAMRVKRRGYRILCATDVFIHHFGQASFKGLMQTGEYDRLFEENRSRFEKKWNITWRPHQYRADVMRHVSLIDASHPLTSADLIEITPFLQRLANADATVQETIQDCGVNILPVNYHSTIPSVKDIRRSFEYAEGQPAPYLNEKIFDQEELSQVLRALSGYASEFNPPAEGDPLKADKFFWNNWMFSHSDALAFYCFIRHYQPKTIVEVGSGFSTLIALEAFRRNGFGRIICVEPYPRPFLQNNPRLTLIQREAQAVSVADFNAWLNDGDFLSVDSTHTVKTGSDCAHLYLRVLPHICHNIVVHTHDVFLPFGIPRDWLLTNHAYWTEQYLVMALLIDNPKTKVLYGSAYHEAFNKDALTRMMDGKWTTGGGSFWYEYNGR